MNGTMVERVEVEELQFATLRMSATETPSTFALVECSVKMKVLIPALTHHSFQPTVNCCWLYLVMGYPNCKNRELGSGDLGRNGALQLGLRDTKILLLIW